jgi:cell division septation protein DedD
MKYNILYISILISIAALLVGCGPSEEEQQREEQARQDSLEQVQQEQQRMEQQRQDSLAKARAEAESMNENESSSTSPDVTFANNGAYTVQTESWRSQQKAQAQVQQWKDRGFTEAYVAKHGDEATGDVWFRVRVGRVDTRQDAQQLRQTLQDEYQIQAWIANAQ